MEKVNRFTKFSQKTCLKPYIDMNTELRIKEKKNDFEKDFFKLMNNTVFEKNYGKCQKW